MRFFLTIWFVLVTIASVHAHKVSIAHVTSQIETEDRSYRVEIKLEIEASLDSETNDTVSPEDAARTAAEETIQVWVDGMRTEPKLDVLEGPTNPFDENETAGEATVFTSVLTGTLPPDATTFALHLSEDAEFTMVHAAAKDGVLARRLNVNYPGETTSTIDITSPLPEIGFFASMFDWARLGFGHVVSRDGLDHILFILALFLLCRKFRPLLWQVTAFTLAHTLTLALGHFGILRLPSSIVEPLIAASIAYVAIENLILKKPHRWRYTIVFALGLLHGLGFAGQLAAYSMPQGSAIPALAAFNIGVEVGQLTIIALAAALLAWFWNRKWYHRAVVIPASLIIAAISLFWTFQRILG